MNAKHSDVVVEVLKILRDDDDTALLLKQADYYVDLKNRMIFFDDDIDTDSAYIIKQRIQMIRAASTPETLDLPITMDLTTFGGDIYGMFATIDVIQEALVPINIVGRGPVMSAGAWILACGTGERVLAKNSIVMLHEISTLLKGTSKDIYKEVDHIKFLQNRMYAQLEEFTNKDAAYWEEHTKTNLYLTSEECVELGLVDRIM